MAWQQASATWLAHFQCSECWIAFRFEITYGEPRRRNRWVPEQIKRLVQGRNLRPIGNLPDPSAKRLIAADAVKFLLLESHRKK
jgi:hypothetical protein